MRRRELSRTVMLAWDGETTPELEPIFEEMESRGRAEFADEGVASVGAAVGRSAVSRAGI